MRRYMHVHGNEEIHLDRVRKAKSKIDTGLLKLDSSHKTHSVFNKPTIAGAKSHAAQETTISTSTN